MHKFLHFNNHYILDQDRARSVRKRFQSRTVAAEALSPDKVKALATAFIGKESFDEEIFAVLNVGITFLSFKDKYNKKTGRDEATTRMKPTELKVIGVVVNNTHIYVNLEALQGVSLNLRINKGSGFSTVTGELVGS